MTWNGKWYRWLALVLTACVLLGFAGGIGYGWRAGVATHQQATQERSGREARVLTWIVETNPEATIRDFLDFPRVLIDESQRRGLDYRLVLAIALKESKMNPRAVGGSGEVGLMQLLPDTAALVARRMGMKDYVSPVRSKVGAGYVSLGTLADPKRNVVLGMEYLAWQIEHFGGVTMTALRAYNRAPERARERWPEDTYAEDVANNFLRLAHAVRD